jgi:hypothetical protein
MLTQNAQWQRGDGAMLFLGSSVYICFADARDSAESRIAAACVQRVFPREHMLRHD